MKRYRNKLTGEIITPYELEYLFRQENPYGHHFHGDKELFLESHTEIEDVTDLYEFLEERFLWSEKAEQVAITEETAKEWIEWWKEDFTDDEYMPLNLETVTAEKVTAIWNYIVQEEE